MTTGALSSAGMPVRAVRSATSRRRSVPTRLNQQVRLAHLTCFRKIVKQVGETVLKFGDVVEDLTLGNHGHAPSTIDAFASETMQTAFSHVYDNSGAEELMHWGLRLLFEDKPVRLTAAGSDPSDDDDNEMPVVIIDEIDGTTNLKRAIAGLDGFRRPSSAVTAALLANRGSSCIEVSAIYCLDDGSTYSALLGEGVYLTFKDDRHIPTSSSRDSKGDSKQRIVVPCYSNHNHNACKDVQIAVEQHVDGGKCEVYGGCRSSTIDVINIIRNEYDAYVDCRAEWTTDLSNNSVLRLYDIAAVLPVALGAGLVAINPDGTPFTLEGHKSDSPISIVICRPRLAHPIVKAIAEAFKK